MEFRDYLKSSFKAFFAFRWLWSPIAVLFLMAAVLVVSFFGAIAGFIGGNLSMGLSFVLALLIGIPLLVALVRYGDDNDLPLSRWKR